jgi:ribosome biogenesis GTPase
VTAPDPALVRIGLSPERAAAWQSELRPGERLARVVAQHRNGWRVDDGHGEFLAGAPAALSRPGGDPSRRPAVGDFVVLGPQLPPTILRVLPRRGAIRRLAAGDRQVEQIIAANVDRVLIVTGLDEDWNPRRIERYLVLARNAGADPVVVLTKLDTAVHGAARVLETQSLLGPEVPVLAVNAKDPATAARLAPFLPPGTTAVLVGSSGAGKSTLTNTLLGEARQRTAEVRRRDGRGRHTTTHRALLRLPGGACLIDTPGMRELKLTGDEDLDETVFDDLARLAEGCRFRDCRHEREPGCAVRDAIEAGRLPLARWQHYVKLRAEREAAAEAARARATARRPRSPDPPRPRRRPLPSRS